MTTRTFQGHLTGTSTVRVVTSPDPDAIDPVQQAMKTRVDHFAASFISALGSKSPKAFADLCLKKSERAGLDTNPALSAAFQMTRRAMCKGYLAEKSDFIDTQNAWPESALTADNISEVIAEEIEHDSDGPGPRIPLVTIVLNEFVRDERRQQITYKIADVFVLEDKLRMPSILSVSGRIEWEEILDPNPDYPQIDSERFSELVAGRIDGENAGYLAEDRWHLHDGDLELDEYDITCNLVITGDLIVHQALVRPDASLVHFAVALSVGGPGGSIVIISDPVGPLLLASTEMAFVGDTSGVECHLNHEAATGSVRSVLLEQFVLPDSAGVFDDVNENELWPAISQGESVLLPNR